MVFSAHPEAGLDPRLLRATSHLSYNEFENRHFLQHPLYRTILVST